MNSLLDNLTTEISNNKVYDALYTLYCMAEEPLRGYHLNSFEYYMQSNIKRTEFITMLNELFINDQMNQDLETAYIDLYPIIVTHMLGGYNKYVYIPDVIAHNAKNDTHNPSNDELDELLEFIKYIAGYYFKYTINHTYTYEFPAWSVDRGKSLEFKFREDYLTQLLGVCSKSSGIVEWIEAELEKEHPEKIKDGKFPRAFLAKNLFGYIITRIDHVKFINNRVNEFVNNYRIKSPELFENGNIKSTYLESFNKVFRDKFGFNYPFIEYNKVIAKSISFLNLISFSCVPELLHNVDNSKIASNSKYTSYMGVYRNSDVFGTLDSEDNSSISKYSNNFLSNFKLFKKGYVKNNSGESLNKISLFGLKVINYKDNVIKDSLEVNSQINYRRLIYKYRMVSKSYYIDKITDEDSNCVYLSDIESEIDYYAMNLTERKQVKLAKKKLLKTLEQYVYFLNSKNEHKHFSKEFKRIVKERIPGLTRMINRIEGK